MFSTENTFVFCSTFALVFAAFYLPRAWLRRVCWLAAGALSLAAGIWLFTGLANNSGPATEHGGGEDQHSSSLNSSGWQAPDQTIYSI